MYEYILTRLPYAVDIKTNNDMFDIRGICVSIYAVRKPSNNGAGDTRKDIEGYDGEAVAFPDDVRGEL